MTWTNGLRATQPIAWLLCAVLPSTRAGQVGQAVNEGAERIGFALIKRPRVAGTCRVGELAEAGVEFAAVLGGQGSEQGDHGVFGRGHSDVAVVVCLAAALADSGGIDGRDDAGAHVCQASTGQPGATDDGRGKGLLKDAMFDLGDELVGDVAGGGVNDGGPVHNQLSGGQGGADLRQTVPQAQAQADQPAGVVAGDGQRGTDLGLGNLQTISIPATNLLRVALLAEPVVGESGDHRQLSFRDRRLHPSEIRHRIDQLARRQCRGRRNRVA